jgi:ABC-type branched-subunit amino acid transport system substrate-binding protein
LSFAADPSLNVTLIPVEPYQAHYIEEMKVIIRESLSIVVCLCPHEHEILGVTRDALDADMIGVGRAWVFLDMPDHFDSELLPRGVIGIVAKDARDDLLTDFNHSVIIALDPVQYPGTGPNTNTNPLSLLFYDAIHVIKDSIDSLNLKSSSVNGVNMISEMHSLNFSRTSGSFTFDQHGQRSSQNFQVLNFMGPGHHPVEIAVWNASSHDFAPHLEIINSTVVWPGDTFEVPQDSDIEVPLVFISDLNPPDTSLSPLQENGTRSLIKYAVHLANSRYGCLPHGHKIEMLIFDDHGDPANAILKASEFNTYGIVGAIGSLTSVVSQAIQYSLSIEHIAQISSSATDALLSDKFNSPTFFRNVPSDELRAKGMMSICQHFGWDHIALMSSKDSVGSSLAHFISIEAPTHGIKLQAVFQNDLSFSGLEEQIGQLMSKKVKIVVFSSPTPSLLINAVKLSKKIGFKPNAWFGTENWIVDDFESQLNGTGLTTADFDGFVSINPSGGIGDQFTELLTNLTTLDPIEYPGLDNIDALRQSYVARTFDTVFIYADAIRRIVLAGDNPRDPRAITQALFQTHLNLTTGSTSFNIHGDRIGSYDINNSIDGKLQFSGRWMVGSGASISHPIVWPDGTTTIPSSTPPIVREWLKIKSSAGVIFSVFASVGIVISLLLSGLVIHQWNSPVIRSATPPFLLVMLAGCMIGYGTIWTWVGEPHDYICVLRIWLSPLAYIFIMAPLLTKTWRLHRIFTLGSLKIAPIPLYKLIIMCCGIIAIQVVICIVWVSLGSFHEAYFLESDNEFVAHYTCSQTSVNRIITFVTYGYFGLITLIGGYLAFKVRNLPKDFNESRWIGLAIYNTVLWGTLVIILGYSMKKFPTTVLILCCVASLAITTGAISFMLIPKMWTLWKHPEKRSSSSGPAGSTNTATSPMTDTSVSRKFDYSYRPPNSNNPRNVSGGTSKERTYSK